MPSAQEYREDGDVNDFSCYITIQNNSDSDLLLADFGIEGRYGVWPLYQPLNTIEAKSAGRVHLKDPIADGGSEGWLLYEVKVKDRVEQFKLKFADPAAFWNDNYLETWSSDTNRLKVEVKPYEKSGHPFYGQVSVWTNPHAVAEENPKSCPWMHGSETSQSKHGGSVRANFEIGFDYPGPGEKHPIHESIAIAAFIRSMVIFPKATTYNNLNPKQWEYFRGMIWNDDPSCLLFRRSENDSRLFGIGKDWWEQFQFGSPKCMTQRSHFGDLQFLHAMGSHEGELPYDTRDRLLKWIGIMYKLACTNQGVLELQPLRDHFPELFTSSTDPSGGTTLRDLILATTPEYRFSNIPLRALGICMHIIEDSYAIGHVQRRLLNPQDFVGRDPKRYISFKPGTWGHWGTIVSFHTYGHQNDKRHSFYDGLGEANLPNPKDLNTFNRLHGARDAIDACILLINAFAQKHPWEELRQELEGKVFAIDPEAKPCNSAVDDVIPGVDYPNTPNLFRSQNVEYEARLACKLSALESGLQVELVPRRECRGVWLRNNLKRAKRYFILAFLVLLVFWTRGSSFQGSSWVIPETFRSGDSNGRQVKMASN